jgi:hypothetical protein
MSTVVTAAARSEATPGTRTRNRFFLAMAATLLLIVLIGFSPSLYLRVFFPVPPIPGYLHLHGVVLTGWFVWLCIQASLIQAGRPATHRRLGVIGAGLGVAVVGAALLATLNIVSRITSLGIDLEADASALGIGVSGVRVVEFAAGVVWGNLTSVVVFAALLASAILLRGNAQAHKRLVLLASIAIIGPALARISRWPIFGGEQGPFVPLVLLLLVLAVVANDVIATRRVHPATVAGIGVAVVVVGARGLLFAFAPEIAKGFVRWLA